MIRSIVAALAIVILGLVVPLPSIAAEPPVASGRNAISVAVTKYGEMVYTHAGAKPASLSQSLRDMWYTQGYTQLLATPLPTLLMVLTHRATPSSALNTQAFEHFFAVGAQHGYGDVIAAVVPPLTREINTDFGTLERTAATPFRYEDMQGSLLWWAIPTIAQGFEETLDPEVRSLLTAWLRGAKQAALDNRAKLYAQHPLLAEARVIEAFQQSTIVDLIAVVDVMGKLYEWGTIVGDSLLTAAWPVLGAAQPAPRQRSLIPFAPMSGSSAPTSLQELFHQPPKPFGASNGYAMTFYPADKPDTLIAAMGFEPHQPFGHQTRMTQNSMLLEDASGLRRPYSFFVFPGVQGVAGIAAGEGGGMNGTAAPTEASGRFFVPIQSQDGLTYLDPADNQVKSFTLRTIEIPRNGAMVSVQVREIGAGSNFHGRVYLMRQQPGTLIWYAFAMRMNKVANSVNNLWLMHLNTIKRNQEEFINAAKRSVHLWNATGIISDHNNQPHPFQAMFQGRTDRIEHEGEAGYPQIAPFTVNPAMFNRVGSYDTPMCVDARQEIPNGPAIAVANNGSVGHNCGPQEAGHRRDAAYPTYDPERQAMVTRFWEDHDIATTPISRQAVFDFFTTTESPLLAKLNEMMIASVFIFGGQVVGGSITAETIAFAQAVASAMIGSNGATSNSPFTIIQFYALTKIQPLLFVNNAGIAPQVQAYIRGPSSLTLQDAVNAIDLDTARTLIQAYTEAITFVIDKCLIQRGMLNWNEIATIRAGNRVLAQGTAGGGVDTLNLNNWSFVKDATGAPTCEVVSETSSPLKGVVVGGEVCILPHGGLVSEFSILAPNFYDKQHQAWSERWAQMNRDGSGKGNKQSYLCRDFSEANAKNFRAQFEPDVAVRFEISVPADLM